MPTGLMTTMNEREKAHLLHGRNTLLRLQVLNNACEQLQRAIANHPLTRVTSLFSSWFGEEHKEEVIEQDVLEDSESDGTAVSSEDDGDEEEDQGQVQEEES